MAQSRAPHSDPPSMHSLKARLERLSRFSRRNAFFWREGVRWRRRTYEELQARIRGCAAVLSESGAREGSRLLIQGASGPDWVEALLAAWSLGAVAVPLDEATPETFRSEVARRSGATLLVAPKGIAPPAGCSHVALGSWEPRPAFPASLPAWDPERTAEIVFTSGTTGEPKGVVLTHGNLAADFAPVERGFLKREDLVRRFGELRLLSALPLSHMFGQALNVFLPLFMGLTVVFVPPRPRDVMEASRRMRAWGLFGVPRLIELLAAETRLLLREEGALEAIQRRQELFATWPFYIQPFFFRSVQRMFGWRFRLFVSGGAALPEETQGFWERCGFLVVQGYGLTETAPIVSISNPFRRGTGGVGKPLGIQEVKLGPDGEVLVRGPNVTRGYFGAAETGEWFHTGDIGEFDAQGHLRIRGRAKDVIVTAEGENVYPGDVEAALAHAGGVREACVLGLPGPGGERVHAVLVMEEGASAEESVRVANASLQPKQRIKDYTVWRTGDLPRTATGKVRKGVLKDLILNERAQPEAATASGSVQEKVKRIVARVGRLDPVRIRPESRLADDLGFASLDLVELAVAFEEEFGIALPEERMNEATISDLVAAAEETTGRFGAAARSSTIGVPESAETTARSGAAGPRIPSALTAGSLSLTMTPSTGSPAGTSSHSPGGSGAESRVMSAPATSSGSTTATSPQPPASTSRPGSLEPAQERRGSLKMPRWARRAPMRWLRRGIEELLMRPFVLCFDRNEIRGIENLSTMKPPFLFVANHHSYWDTGLMKTAIPAPLRGRISPAMTTRYHRVYFGEVPGGALRYLKEWIQVRLVEFFFNAWPLPETAGFRSSLSYAGELADDGWSLLIFPEGRHVPEGSMEPFRGGIGIFARELRMPVIPIWMEGTANVLPEKIYFPRFGKTRLVIGAPILVEPDVDLTETKLRLEQAVRELGRR